MSYEFCRSREETGLVGSSGDTFVVELRDRLERQGELPPLPTGWRGEAVLRPAGGGPFAGDFVVSARTTGGRVLEVALVDVSGKGVEAGTRSLLLSGALGGLLGSLPPLGVPARGEPLPRAAGLGRGVRDGGAPGGRPGRRGASRSSRPGTRRSRCSTRAPAAGACSRPRASRSACCRRCRTTRSAAGSTAATRCCCTPTGWSRCPGATCPSASTSCSGRRSGWCRAGSPGAASVLVSRVADAGHDDRGLVLLWREA